VLHEPLALYGAQQAADQGGTVESYRNLGVPANQRHSRFAACLHTLEEGLNSVTGNAFGKKGRHEQPARLGAGCGEIITVNCQEVLPEVFRGKRQIGPLAGSALLPGP
jgi:hypothetical protein